MFYKTVHPSCGVNSEGYVSAYIAVTIRMLGIVGELARLSHLSNDTLIWFS